MAFWFWEISWRLSLCFASPVQKGRETFLNKSLMCDCIRPQSDTNENLSGRFNQKPEAISRWCERNLFALQDNGWSDEMAAAHKSVKGDCFTFQKVETAWMFQCSLQPWIAKLKRYKKVKLWGTIGTYHYQFVRDKDQASKVVEKKQAEKL